jgi:two-component system chemotaxis response regulator CheY
MAPKSCPSPRRCTILDGLIKRTGPSARRPLREAINAAASAPKPVAQPRPVAPARERHCLIVDDSRMIRKFTRTILEGLGYKVAEAENGEEALGRCKAAMPDLILLDWNMPVMSGVEFVSALRQEQASLRPKVVFCTSNADTDHIRKGIEAGADEYIIKPFDQPTLQAKLQRIGAA